MSRYRTMTEACPSGREGWVRFSLQESAGDGKTRCLACPRYCVIAPGSRGACKTKVNSEGTLCEVNYGKMSSVAMDPIEKKPLFHFMPGSWAYSIGTVGCNLMCDYCQNWQISQGDPLEFPWLTPLSPEQAVLEAKRASAKSIAYTYNEPTVVSLQWVVETARLAKSEGLKNLSITNGYWSRETRGLLVPLIDAANVDIKAFRDEFYQKVCKVASMKPVLDTAIQLKEGGVHIELTYLVIPDLNDDEDEIREFAKWVSANMGIDTPVHFSRFWPNYQMTDRPPTPTRTIERSREITMEEGVRFVYCGNLPGDPGESTYCPNCGELLIKRHAFDVIKCNLDKENRCSKCGEPVPVVGPCSSRRWSFLGLTRTAMAAKKGHE